MSRLQDLENKLKARTRPDGTALPNYGSNVAALRKEIAALKEAEQRLAEASNGDQK